MKGLVQFLLLSIFLVLFSCEVSQKTQKSDISLVVTPGEGVGDLLVNQMKKSQVEDLIGKGKVIEYPSPFGHGVKFKKVYYPEWDMELSYTNHKRPQKSDTLEEINLIGKSSLRTSVGIGIGSTRTEIENIYGQPNSSQFVELTLNQGYYHAISYDNIQFVFNPHETDSMSASVEQITLW